MPRNLGERFIREDNLFDVGLFVGRAFAPAPFILRTAFVRELDGRFPDGIVEKGRDALGDLLASQNDLRLVCGRGKTGAKNVCAGSENRERPKQNRQPQERFLWVRNVWRFWGDG